jgi:hypothetical protein
LEEGFAMTKLRLILTSLTSLTALSAALTVSACGGDEPGQPDVSPYAGGERNAAETDAAAPAAGVDASEDEDGDALDPLEIVARDTCAAGDEGFAGVLPGGSAFASRGPDARVHAGWNVDGRTHETIIYTPSLEQEARLAFDGAVADFMRRNLVADLDRNGLTGAYRYRDGRFCVVQTEAEAIAPLQAAVRAAEAALSSSED